MHGVVLRTFLAMFVDPINFFVSEDMGFRKWDSFGVGDQFADSGAVGIGQGGWVLRLVEKAGFEGDTNTLNWLSKSTRRVNSFGRSLTCSGSSIPGPLRLLGWWQLLGLEISLGSVLGQTWMPSDPYSRIYLSRLFSSLLIY